MESKFFLKNCSLHHFQFQFSATRISHDTLYFPLLVFVIQFICIFRSIWHSTMSLQWKVGVTTSCWILPFNKMCFAALCVFSPLNGVKLWTQETFTVAFPLELRSSHKVKGSISGKSLSRASPNQMKPDLFLVLFIDSLMTILRLVLYQFGGLNYDPLQSFWAKSRMRCTTFCAESSSVVKKSSLGSLTSDLSSFLKIFGPLPMAITCVPFIQGSCGLKKDENVKKGITGFKIRRKKRKKGVEIIISLRVQKLPFS